MPLRSPEPIAARDLDDCRAKLRAGSRSFNAAAKLLPATVRDAAIVLYAFCREADDAVDLGDDKDRAVAMLRDRLDGIYRGRPRDHACDRALAGVVDHHILPRELLDALIEGFEWDACGRRYASLADLEDYAARVAGTVGAMMAVLMGVRSPIALARACDLGVAMQLTNIARDVGEDAREGRLYLPLEWLDEAGIDPGRWLADPRPDPRLRAVVQRLLTAADTLYGRVNDGIAQLKPACRPGIQAARLIYADIGRVLRRPGFDPVLQRAVVPGHRKAWLLVKSYLLVASQSAGAAHPPLAATRYLVEAVGPLPASRDAEVAAVAGDPTMARGVRAKALWVIDLFERLEMRDRMAAAAAHGIQPERA
jgi:phytoene synthase